MPTPKPIKARPEKTAPGKPVLARASRELTELQEQVCDLAGDLIVNGGHEDDVDELLFAVMAHFWRRRFPDYPRSQEEREKNAVDFAEKHRASWLKRLARHWPEEPTPRAVEPLPQTVSEMVRANDRGVLKERFEDFMREVEGLADIHLLSDVLNDWSGGNNQLPEAFAYQIGRSDTYVKVPQAYLEQVQKLVQVLTEGKSDEAA